jgi:hypothetical protein
MPAAILSASNLSEEGYKPHSVCTFVNLALKSELPWLGIEERLGWANLVQVRRESENILRQLPRYQYHTISGYHCDCGTFIGAAHRQSPAEDTELDYWIGGLTRLVANPKIMRVGLFHFFGDDSTLDRIELKCLKPIGTSTLTERVLRDLQEHTVLQLEFDGPPAGYSVLGARL